MIVRALGLAAIVGGVLRIVDSFATQSFSPMTLSLLYFFTDAFLLLGIAGIYWRGRTTLGVAGIAGAAIFALGIAWIRIAAYAMPGTNGYQLGAAIALLGLAILSGEALWRGHGSGAAPVLWLAALLFGIVGALGLMVPVMMIAAGVAFGAGFVMAGRQVMATPATAR